MTAPLGSLTDPHSLEAHRHALEVKLTAAGVRGLREFLSSVEGDALSAWTPNGALVAAGGPWTAQAFTLGKTYAAWGRTVTSRIMSAVKEAHGVEDTTDIAYDPFLAPLYRALTDAPIVGRVYDAARTALLTNATLQRAAVARDLTRSLDPKEWEAGIRAMARQAATASHNSRVVTALAASDMTQKQWVALHDDHTRPTHRAADGQVRALSASFIVGGYALMIPGDPTAPLSETAGCRCVVIGVRS